jgi:hypothetical protein
MKFCLAHLSISRAFKWQLPIFLSSEPRSRKAWRLGGTDKKDGLTKRYVLFSNGDMFGTSACSHLRRFWHAFTLSGASETRLIDVCVSQTHLACIYVIWGIGNAFCMSSRRLENLISFLDALTLSQESETRSGRLYTISRV